MSIQDTYIDTVRSFQEAWTTQLQALSTSASKAFGVPTSPFSTDAEAAVDQIFDFWTKTLEVQRDLTKQLVSVASDAGEKVRAHADSLSFTAQEDA
jgi:hypothetical protein